MPRAPLIFHDPSERTEVGVPVFQNRVWTRQPTGAAQIARSPINNGLQFASYPGGGSQVSLQISTKPTIKVSGDPKFGALRSWNFGGSGDIVSIENIGTRAFTTSDLTFLVVCKPGSLTTGTIIGQRWSAVQCAQMYISDPTLWVNINSTGTSLINASTVMAAGTWTVLVLRFSDAADNMDLYYRNNKDTISQIKTASGANTASVGDPGVTPSLGARWGTYPSSTGYEWDGDIALGAAWNRAVSDAEARSLMDNPWQIFR